MRLALVAALAAVFVSPALAQEQCPTVTIERLQSLVEDAGGEIIGGAAYDGASTDMAVIYVLDDGFVRMALFKDGCAVGDGPVGIDRLAPEESPRQPKVEAGA